MQDLNGLLRANLRNHASRLASICNSVRASFCFTELDQAFIAWGLIALAIFGAAQFSPLSWTNQAIIDAALTGAGIAGTSGLTWEIACIANLRWVVFVWATLMSFGMVVTAYGIFGGVGFILVNLCVLWLGLCTLGYAMMAVGMGSRCFAAMTLVHGLAIALPSVYPSSQFIISGWVIALTLFFFSVVPWDMREAEPDAPC
ncbi:MAG: hypothetical protein WA885_12950 [Phormidesmis sp.]